MQARNFINTEIELKWFSYCDSVIIEYGPAGFVPGTGFAPGAGGDTILTVGISNLNITGLPANGHYDIYLRSVCGGTCSPNSIRERINLNTPCNRLLLIAMEILAIIGCRLKMAGVLTIVHRKTIMPVGIQLLYRNVSFTLVVRWL